MADNPYSVDVVNPLQALLLGQQSYASGIENNKKQAMEAARNEAGQLYAQGDTKGALARLLQGGDLQGAGTYSGLDQQQWTRQHTTAQDAENARRWGITDKRAAAAEGRAASDFENTPDQYTPNPKFGQPGEPQYIDQYAAARAAGEASVPGAGKNGLQPVWGVKNGQPAIIQMSPSGTAVETKMPEGFQVAKDPIKVDAGTHFILLDPQTRQQIGTIPKDLAGAERDKVLGEETGKGMVALPQVLATANQTLKSIEDVRNHPGRAWGTGALGTIPGIPGTQQRGFVTALDQLKGKTFLEAFNSLRGGGAITEVEGAKATNAMARLDRAQNDKDFESALNDLRDVVKSGMLRAAAKAKGAGGMIPAASAVSSQGNGADVMLQHARDAIAQGAPRDAVLQRLQQSGVDASGL